NVLRGVNLSGMTVVEFLLKNIVQGIGRIFTIGQSSDSIYSHGINALEGGWMSYPVPSILNVSRHGFTRSSFLLSGTTPVIKLSIRTRDSWITKNLSRIYAFLLKGS